MSVEMPSGVMVADMLEGIRFALGPAVALRRDALEKIGGIAATADYYSDDFVLGNLIWAAGYKVVFSHHIIQHVLTPRSLTRTLGDQLRWMKSTRFSRPLGHVGTGLTYAVPFGVLGLIAAAALGHWKVGALLFAVAFANRVVQSIAVGWGIIGDRRARGPVARPGRLVELSHGGPLEARHHARAGAERRRARSPGNCA